MVVAEVRFPLLDLLPETERQAELSKLKKVRYRAGEAIYERGGDCMDVFFIFEGVVKITSSAQCGNTAFFHHRHAGQIIGYYAAITEKPQPVTATAAESCWLGRMAGAEFMEMVLRRRDLSAWMLRTVAGTLCRETNRIRNLILFDAPCRVAGELLECLEETGGTAVSVEDRTEFAARLGMTRETLARHLWQLQREGLISIRKQEIHVLDAEQLAQLIA